jgi:hypothetical protein
VRVVGADGREVGAASRGRRAARDGPTMPKQGPGRGAEAARLGSGGTEAAQEERPNQGRDCPTVAARDDRDLELDCPRFGHGGQRLRCELRPLLPERCLNLRMCGTLRFLPWLLSTEQREPLSALRHRIETHPRRFGHSPDYARLAVLLLTPDWPTGGASAIALSVTGYMARGEFCPYCGLFCLTTLDLEIILQPKDGDAAENGNEVRALDRPVGRSRQSWLVLACIS